MALMAASGAAGAVAGHEFTGPALPEGGAHVRQRAVRDHGPVDLDPRAGRGGPAVWNCRDGSDAARSVRRPEHGAAGGRHSRSSTRFRMRGVRRAPAQLVRVGRRQSWACEALRDADDNCSPARAARASPARSKCRRPRHVATEIARDASRPPAALEVAGRLPPVRRADVRLARLAAGTTTRFRAWSWTRSSSRPGLPGGVRRRMTGGG